MPGRGLCWVPGGGHFACPAGRFLRCPQTAAAPEVGGNQKRVGHNPRGGGGEAGCRKSEDRHQAGHTRPRKHLQHPGQSGQRGEAHALDHKPENIDHRQQEVEEHIGQQTLAGQGQQPRAGLVQKEHIQPVAECPQHPQRRRGVHRPQQHAGADALMEPVPLPGPHVLSAVGGHGGPHGIKGAGKEEIHLVGGRHGRDIDSAQSVDGGLDHHAADGGDGVLQPHGQAHQAQIGHPPLLPAPVLPLHPQHGEAPGQPRQTSQPGHELGEHRGEGRAEHIHMEIEDEDHVQDNVRQGGGDEPDDRRAAVAHGPEDPGGVVVQEVGRQAGEDGDDVDKGPLIDIGGGVHHRQDIPAEEHGNGGERRRADGAQPDAPGHVAAQLLVVARAELLGGGDGKAAAHPGAEAHHQEVDGPGGAHRRQGVAPQGLAHDGGVHHAVELLEQIAKQEGNAEAEDLPHGVPPC